MAPHGSMNGAGGNTIPPRANASIHWMMTLNNYTNEELESLKKVWGDGSIISKFCVQEEKGENGTPHLQGYIAFIKKSRPMELFNNKRIHWEKCRDVKNSILYCSKEETKNGERWTNIVFPKPIKVIKEEQFYGWQHEILNMIKGEPDDRKIYWYWEDTGGAGKSCFSKYLVVKHNAVILSGKGNDCKYGIVKWHESMGTYPELIIYDVPRCNIDYVNYEALESIKNGLFFSGKYESTQVVMNSPHLIIFANEPPDKSKMSADRWHIVRIG